MDIDVLRVSGETEWKRLEQLTRQRSLSGDEIDEFDRLYRSTTTDLARVRTLNPDPDVIAELSRILSAARGRLAGTGGLSGTVIARFFTVSLPLTLYRIRWVIVAVMAAFIAIAGVQAHYLMSHPDVMNELGTPEELKYYAQSAFVEYYHQDTNAEFGLSVWANNAWIALVGVATGITGVYPLKILWENATSLRVFWSLLVPGPMTRFQAVGQAARSAMTVAAGCAILLAGSGVLEGFVTPSDLPDAVKIILGALMTAAVWVYILILGRRAHQAGGSADVGIDAGYYQPVSG